MLLCMSTILLMEKILHQLIGSSSHYLQGFFIPGGAGFLPSTVSVIHSPAMSRYIPMYRSVCVLSCEKLRDKLKVQVHVWSQICLVSSVLFGCPFLFGCPNLALSVQQGVFEPQSFGA